jgi:Leucine-rich repeat (LRR) protein
MLILKKMKFELNNLIITTKYIINTCMSVKNFNKTYDIDLQKLDLSYDKNLSLPDSIGNFINLRELNLSHDKLSSLPDSVGNLINLQLLQLQSNQLESLPDSIGNLINLRVLDLENNQLKSLPDSIGNLINLQQLYLSNNKLERLPDSIGNFINLQKLYLEHNKLESLPPSILKIKKALIIHDTSYQINNLNMEAEILIFSVLKNKLINLPISFKEIWIKKGNPDAEHKLPLNCELKYY